ncbi:hypothetical protein [Bacillus phage SRT01hs]|uniref:Major capsid protein n=1 Tax=Bacillus phage SRT01hs TaxID=2847044 RepID=A0A6B9SW65_9CAUD|nr:major head protein [Bacillus phage SRT01hs]QHJ75874.1 hypothetical protein [Bacillus phage SRT01hs]
MARITLTDFKNSLGITESYDIINAIINENPQFSEFANLTSAKDVAEFGTGLLASQTLQNDFIHTLVDRIGLVVIRHKLMNNPLKVFKQGTLEYGRKIEEIFTDLVKEHVYDPETAETEVYKREIPNVKTLFHERNRQVFYKQTISDQQLKAAFTNAQKFDEFLSTILTAVYNSAEVDEFRYTKLLIDNYYSKGLFKVLPVKVQANGIVEPKEFLTKARATARKMTLPMGTRDFNSMAVHTRTDLDDLYIIMDADTEAEIDVNQLASAFNLTYTEFIGRRIIVDGFASTGLKAVMVDKDFFMLYDQIFRLESQRNAQGLYWNYFLHIWQILSTSRFANAVAFVDEALLIQDVTQVIVTPAVGQVKSGKVLPMEAVTRSITANYTPENIVWSLENISMSEAEFNTIAFNYQTNQAKVELNSTMPLPVGGDVRVKATVKDPKSGEDVVGEAHVTITPDFNASPIIEEPPSEG